MPDKVDANQSTILKFMHDKGHYNVVLRRSDILALTQDCQLTLMRVMVRCGHPGWEEVGGGQFIVLPFSILLDGRFSGTELEELQQVTEEYKDARYRKGYYTREAMCEACNGAGCKLCAVKGEEIGNGVVRVLDEMDPEEMAIAEGRKWPERLTPWEDWKVPRA